MFTQNYAGNHRVCNRFSGFVGYSIIRDYYSVDYAFLAE